MRKGAVREKSFAFAVQVVGLCQRLQAEHREYVLSRQVLRSGTAVGALVREAQQAESRADFIHKLAIALKEADETAYWLDLLQQTGYLNPQAHIVLRESVLELVKLLTSIIKATKKRT